MHTSLTSKAPGVVHVGHTYFARLPLCRRGHVSVIHKHTLFFVVCWDASLWMLYIVFVVCWDASLWMLYIVFVVCWDASLWMLYIVFVVCWDASLWMLYIVFVVCSDASLWMLYLVVCSLLGCFTMDVIASAAFGLDVSSQRDPNNQFVTPCTLFL